jgi:hypothetical protein
MVFYLNSDFITEIESNNNSAISALELLSIGRRYGKIILTASREALNYLRECVYVTENTRAVFLHLFENYPINAIILDKVTFYVKVTALRNQMEVIESETSSVLEMSFSYIQDLDIVNGTMVIAENQSEINFYNIISQCYRQNNDMEFLQVLYQPQMGGGHTIATVYNNYQKNKKHFCLCIADSDKKYPESDIGATLKALNKVDDPNNYLCKIIGLEVREVENLIPLDILQKACEQDINHSSGFASISRVVTTIGSHYLLFLDIKDGLTKKKYYTSKDVNYKRFINTVLVDTGLHSESFLNELLMSNIDTLDDTPLIHGLGSTILERSITEINEFRNSKDLKNNLLPEQSDEWTRIGEIFTNWTCSASRLS